MKSISKKDANKALAEYRRLDDYDKLFLLCNTFNPFSKQLANDIFKAVADYEGDFFTDKMKPGLKRKRLAHFLANNYPRYNYDYHAGKLTLTGKMTQTERAMLKSIYPDKSYKDAIEDLFQSSQNTGTNRKTQRAFDKLRAISSVCDIGSTEYLIEFVKYVRDHNYETPPRNKVSPFNILPSSDKFTVEINNFAKLKDFKKLYDSYIEFKERNNLVGVKTARTRESRCFEKQVIAYRERIISEMKRNRLKMIPEVYNAFIPKKYGEFLDDVTLRKARRRIDNMVHAISYVMLRRRNNLFAELPKTTKRYL